MNVAILGLGTVGTGVRTIIEERVPGITVSRILRLPADVCEPCMTSNYDDILGDPSIDAVVEVMGGLEPARTFILQALAAGKHVVTANKAVVAANLGEMCRVAAENGVGLFVEATSGGGIPWIASIAKVRRIDEIGSFSGILNGTSNYLIDRMRKDGSTFDAALARAQELGYAEHDPSADIDGIDVANKTIISAAAAFGCDCTHDLPVSGIRNLTKDDMDAFAAEGLIVKLIGRGVCEGARYAVAVEPQLLPADSVEACVPDNFNIATLVGTTVGPLKFYGQGAGSLPTGNAIVQDLIDCEQGVRPSFDLDSSITYDPSLLVGDYVMRADAAAMPAGGSARPDGTSLFTGLTALAAREMLRTTIEADPAAFMARMPDPQ
ncbi:MAG: homoserine dehydrogenase [Atopobiaceae bacterium]|jgi:homoserine dehydrogenase|nr:homoserine dehydrogenase [Atopobiaceae bacterium]MCI2172864.1 homoserine dehydrogenase [Atopobiaceae bacterium]MCI2207171.1 homoserine dehydrogenase [Atopobiaceae bacterium]